MDSERLNQSLPTSGHAYGKTIGDTLDELLSHPRKLGTLLAFLSIFAALIIVIIVVASRAFGMQTSEIQLGSPNSHIVLETVNSRAGIGEFVVIVTPQGWQKSTIRVRKGDQIHFNADGRICIDVNSILDKVHKRIVLEDGYAGLYGIRRDDDSETRVPEDYFTDTEKQSLILDRPWIDPDGFSLDRFKPSFRSRKQRYLLPGRPAGALVGAIVSGSNDPDKGDAFLLGKESDYVAEKDGALWFTVNDVQYADTNNPNLFYNDNIGSFWVHVEVKK